jgi:exosortase/archaeosortase family protein
MKEPVANPEQYSPEQRENIFFMLVILAVMVIAYGPLMGGVWEMSARTTQALNAFVLLAVAFGDALHTAMKRAPFRPVIQSHGLLLFGLSCLALVMASVSQVWPLAVLGLCFNVGALLSFCFGRLGVRAFYPALASLGVMVILLVLVPQADEQLRVLAGRVSASVLPLLGIRTEFIVQQVPFQVYLVAEKGAGVFNVATECNGVGILLSSVVLSLMVSLKRRLPAYGVLLLLMVSIGVGLAFNSARIVAIALSALRTDLDYSFIHEGIGTALYLLALLTVWWINSRFTGTRPSCESGQGVH